MYSLTSLSCGFESSDEVLKNVLISPGKCIDRTRFLLNVMHILGLVFVHSPRYPGTWRQLFNSMELCAAGQH